MTAPLATVENLRNCLCQLQDHIRNSVLKARIDNPSMDFAAVAAETAADTIYEVDKISEEAIFEWIRSHWPAHETVQIVMEGVEDDSPVTFPEGLPVDATKWKLIMDPIDGTRNIMYDKRSAWILAGIAPQKGYDTNLSHITIAAMTELPPSKQTLGDQISAIKGGGAASVLFNRVDVRSGAKTKIQLHPSRADHFRHCFASIVKFFPDGKEMVARLEEEFWHTLNGAQASASPMVFDDQYISSGGQFYELIVGHDRFLADLRPLVFKKLGLQSSLVCHPYDVCTALIAQELGVIIEKPDGTPLDAPLDTTSAVAWVGYANPKLAALARPVLQKLIAKHL